MSLLHRCVFLLAVPLGAILPVYPSAAEAKKPGEVQVTTPVYRPDFNVYQPPLGTYVYEVSWQGIPAAEAKIIVEREGEEYKITTSARTYSAIDLLYKLRYSATGILSAQDLLPQSLSIHHTENSRKKEIFVSFNNPNGEIRSARSQKGGGVKEEAFVPNNFTLDPFSAAFIARGLPWTEGVTHSFDTFNGKSRYLISLTAKEKKVIELDDGTEREAWVIVPTVYNLTESEQNKKLREAHIYLSTDKSRDILKIVSSVFVGSVTTELTSYSGGTPRAATSIAQDHNPGKKSEAAG